MSGRLTVKETVKKRQVRAGQFDGSKPGPGRPPSVRNKTTLEGRELAQSQVKDPRYVAQLTATLLAGSLDPRLEVMLWNYAYGKPKETVDVNATVPHSRKEEFKQKALNLGSLAAIEALERKIATAFRRLKRSSTGRRPPHERPVAKPNESAWALAVIMGVSACFTWVSSAMRDVARNHVSSSVRVSWKIVPAVTEV